MKILSYHNHRKAKASWSRMDTDEEVVARVGGLPITASCLTRDRPPALPMSKERAQRFLAAEVDERFYVDLRDTAPSELSGVSYDHQGGDPA